MEKAAHPALLPHPPTPTRSLRVCAAEVVAVPALQCTDRVWLGRVSPSRFTAGGRGAGKWRGNGAGGAAVMWEARERVNVCVCVCLG